MAIPTNQCLNILVLGESFSSDKSTTFNAFANYSKFPKFEDAKLHNLVQVNSNPLNLFSPESGGPLSGNLYNQNLIAYSFNYSNNLFQFIDVPGLEELFGDIPVDKTTLDNVFNYLVNLELHAICILVKSTLTLKKESFRVVMSELITRLPKCSFKNVFFYFPSGPSFLYNQSEGKANLNEYLRSNCNEVKLDFISDENCFYINGDAYRYLSNEKSGLSRFNQDGAIAYMPEEIWNNSTKQALSVISKLFELKPFRLELNISFGSENELSFFYADDQMEVDCDMVQTSEVDKQMDAAVETISSSKSCETLVVNKKYILGEKLHEKQVKSSCKELLIDFSSSSSNESVEKADKTSSLTEINVKTSITSNQHIVMNNISEFDYKGSEKHFEMSKPQESCLMNSVSNESVKIAEKIIVDSESQIPSSSLLDRKSFKTNKSEPVKVDTKVNQLINTVPSNSQNRSRNETTISKRKTALAKSSGKEYNILLLGETGAGKSTTINAIANYLKYSSFDEAISGKFAELIPSKFMLPDPESGEPFVIESGIKDDNELHGDGSLVTQAPLGYKFQFGEAVIRIIDTPGMGVTTGPDVDKLNFDKILSYLNYHKNLQGICILIKSTETRKTASFRYCINQLLTHLHKSACKNIVFCFTFSRNSYYGPGEGFTTLRGFLQKELSEVELDLKPRVNCFFIDNEAYRFLVAKKFGYPFLERQQKSYQESWDNSVEQTQEMFEYFLSLEPHLLNETCSLNSARKLILQLAEPMVKLQVNANDIIEQIKLKIKRVRSCSKNQKEMAQNLNLEVEDLSLKPLPSPATVCTSQKCIEVVTIRGMNKILYKTLCHEKCYLTGISENIIGHHSLTGCQAFSRSNNCRNCGCSWQLHMHQKFEYIKVKRTIFDRNKEIEMNSTADSIKQITETIGKMSQTLTEYRNEVKVINEVCAKFAYILSTNSNTIYCKFIEPYLDLLIDEEAKKVTMVHDYPRAKHDLLVEMKKTHQEYVNKLTEAIKDKSHPNVTIEHINLYRDHLLQLKHSGPQFQQMLETTEESKHDEWQSVERSTFNSVTNYASKFWTSILKKFGMGITKRD